MKSDSSFYKRAIVLRLYNTKIKKRKVSTLIRHYRKAVNQYLKSFDKEEGGLDKETLARIKTRLSERYKSNALKQALGIWQGCKKTKKKVPKFNGFPILDKKFVTIEQGNNSFDLWLLLSTMKKGRKIYLPTKKHKRLQYWLDKGELIQGCELHENKVIIWVKVKKQVCKEGSPIGIDLGMNKLIATSDKQLLGLDISKCIDSILCTKPNSKERKRAYKSRDIYINNEIKKLPWDKINLLCYENLKNIKKGKNGRRKYKSFRTRQKHWTVSQVISRILEKCQENRVCPVYVNPKNTSRTCPACGNVSAANRTDECFCCLACGHKQDADIVGAVNILRRGLDWMRSQSPSFVKPCYI